MTNNNKTEYIDKLVTIAYFWLSDENINCPVNIYKLIKKLSLNGKELKRAEDLLHDIKTISKNPDILNEYPDIEIPPACKTEEDKLLWIVITTIMNLFNSGNFEMGYTFLLEYTETWSDVYLNIIALLKTAPFKEDLIEWSLNHFFFVRDILGQDEFSKLGYTIKKNEN